MPQLVFFDDPSAKDPLLVGAKGARLAHAAALGLPVPKGFVVTNQGQLGTHEQIIEALSRLGGERFVVRSSATAEDLDRNSFAGVYSSLTNVTAANLIQAVEAVLTSHLSPEAAAYRKQRGIAEGAMAVLVQEQIDPDIAGVVFTRNPLDGSKDSLVANVVAGLSENLMAGEESGVHVEIDRQGGILEQDGSLLNSRQAQGLAKLVRAAEQAFGGELDIEFAVKEEMIYLLQVRPITTLKVETTNQLTELEKFRRAQIVRLRQRINYLRETKYLKESEALYSMGNFSELLPQPTPMSFDIFRYIFTDNGGIQIGRRQMGYTFGSRIDKGFIELAFGQVLTNFEIDAHAFDMGIPLDVAGYMAAIREDPHLALYPELGLYEQTPSLERLVNRFGADLGQSYFDRLQEFMRGIRTYEETYANQFQDEIEPALESYLTEQRRIDITALSNIDLVNRFTDLLEHLRTFSCVQFVIAARLAFFATERLRGFVTKLHLENADELLQNLLSGLPSSEVSQEVFDLQKVLTREMSRDAFANKFGHLASNELEISVPRRHETGLDRYLDEVSETELAQTIAHLHAQRKKREQAEQAFFQAISPFSDIDQADATQTLQAAQRYLPLRETIKYYFSAEYDLLRQTALELAHRAKISEEAIFFLFIDELRLVIDERKRAVEIIELRRIERELAKQLQPLLPQVMFESKLAELGTLKLSERGAEVEGKTVSPGQVLGRVMHVDPDTVDVPEVLRLLEASDYPVILCTRSANLGMDPLIRQSAGLILEIGGLLAHGAVRAREAGIPAIVVDRARKLIPDGSMVMIDDGLKIVRIIDKTKEGGGKHE